LVPLGSAIAENPPPYAAAPRATTQPRTELMYRLSSSFRVLPEDRETSRECSYVSPRVVLMCVLRCGGRSEQQV